MDNWPMFGLLYGACLVGLWIMPSIMGTTPFSVPMRLIVSMGAAPMVYLILARAS